MVRKKKGTEDLFSPQNPKDLFIFTNNNNLRHYYSTGSILAEKYFLTDIYNPSPSTHFHDYICIFNKFPISQSDEISSDQNFNDTIFPIALKLNPTLFDNIDVNIISSNFKSRKSNLNSFNFSKDLVALTDKILPLLIIEKIYFRNQDELLNFSSVQPKNIKFDVSSFEVNSAIFSDSFYFESNKIILDDYKEIQPQHSQKNISIAFNKLKGAFISLFEFFEYELIENVFVNFDIVNLGLIENILSSDVEISGFEDFDLLSNEIKSLKLNSKNNSIIEDPTPLIKIDIILLFKSILNNNFEDLNKELNYGKSNLEIGFDKYLFFITVKNLFSLSSSKDFVPKIFVHSLKAEFLNDVKNYFSNADPSEFDLYTSRYENFFEEIVKIILSQKKISDVLQNLPNNSNVIKSLIFLVNNYQSDKSTQLIKNISAFRELNPFNRRLVVFFYSILNGLAPLDHEFKHNPQYLLLAHLFAEKIIYGNCSLTEFNNLLLKKNKTNIKFKPVSEYSDNLYKYYSAFSSRGVKFFVKVFDTLSYYHEKISKILSNNDSEDLRKIQGFFLTQPISDGYVNYVTVLPPDYTIRNSNKMYTNVALHSSKQFIEWEKFKLEYLSDINKFSKILTEDLKNLIDDIFDNKNKPK